MTKRRIGILGGISHESTIVYYQRLIEGYYARFRDTYYPEVVIYSLDFQRFTDMEDRGETAKYVDYIIEGLNALLAIIHRAAQREAFDGVILGCTELPILLQQAHTPIPLYDTLSLHVRAMLDLALPERINVQEF